MIDRIFMLLLILVLFIMAEKHNRDLKKAYEKAQEERKELLDRIMSNNIQEFKAVNGNADIKRSENGNYIVDRMQQSIRSKFTDLD